MTKQLTLTYSLPSYILMLLPPSSSRENYAAKSVVARPGPSNLQRREDQDTSRASRHGRLAGRQEKQQRGKGGCAPDSLGGDLLWEKRAGENNLIGAPS